MAVIPKSDKSRLTSVSGYRGISLLSVPGKCFEKLIISRLSKYLVRTNNIRNQQYSFKVKISTEHAIKRVTDFLLEFRVKNWRSCDVALDFKGAFDNVWHLKILSKLSYHNIEKGIKMMS